MAQCALFGVDVQCGYGICLVVGCSFFVSVDHISMTQATVICDMAFIGVALGCPLFGWLDSVLNSGALFCGLVV